MVLTSKQSKAWGLLTDGRDAAVLFGGGKGGGKTVFFCLWVYHFVQLLIEYFSIDQPLKEPLPVGFMGRKQGVDFRKTTLETFYRNIPSMNYRVRTQDQEIIFFDRVKVYYGGLDDRERINKFNSSEFAFFALDQAEETDRGDISVLQGALRLKYNDKTPPYKQLYTANPADCWLKQDFIDEPVSGYHFIPALHSDNPHLPDNYVETLTKAFRHNSALLDAYLNGNWYSLQAVNALLSAQQFADLKGVRHHPKNRKGVVVCDPSLGGDDCVIKVMENYKVIDIVVLHIREPMKIAGHMIILGERHKIPNYAADTTGGLGEAILDRIREIKPNSRRFYLSYAEKADYFVHGLNLRSEMAWHYMMKVIDKTIPYPEDEDTRKQILAMRFKVVDSDGHILLERKSETKKALGRSPDLADAEIMGIWALDQTEPIMEKDVWRDDRSYSQVGGGARSAMTA